HFEISFITLEDNGDLANIAGTHLLYYVKKNDNWVFQRRVFFTPEEKPLNLTFEDIEEHHNKLIDGDFEFETIQVTDIDESNNNNLIFQIRVFITPEEKPLHLKFEDIEEHHNKLIDGDFEFEAIQETDIDGINHLVYRIGNEYYARNEHNSTFNYEVVDQ